MRSLGIIILVLVIKLAAVSAAMTGQDPKDLIKAATSRPRTRAPQPDSPALSSEMRERIVTEITASEAVRRAAEVKTPPFTGLFRKQSRKLFHL
jgi:hypothetical protein